MKMKTGLWALGLFTLAGTTIVNCGGSSDDGDDTGTSGQAGTKTTAGSSSTGGATTAGTSSTGGNTGTAGSSTAGTGGTGTAGTNSGTAGDSNQGGANDNPGAGGGDNSPGCPATMPADGSMCTQENNVRGGCDYGAMNCRCARNGGGQMRSWQCEDANLGAGGDNGGFGNATCPANAMDGNDCTGFGLCPGQATCFCFQGNVNCP